MGSYYRKYIKDYSKVVAPLVKLTKHDEEYLWTTRCQESFEKVKTLLASKPILTLPTQGDPFVLAVDFSYLGMGLVLS